MTLTSAREPIVSNYKISFRTQTPLRLAVRKLEIDGRCICEEDEDDGPEAKRTAGSCICSVKLLHNFAVVQTCRHVYTLNDSGFVNITKIRHLSDVEAAVTVLRQLVHLPQTDCYSICVDNVTASGAFGRPIPLHKLSSHVATHAACKVVKLGYRPNYFSGASVRYHGGGGTIILFTTGAFTIVGAKSDEQVWHIYRQTQRLLLSLLS